jgi:hypothetical protein
MMQCKVRGKTTLVFDFKTYGKSYQFRRRPELISDRKSINFTDKKGMGRLKPKETRDLHFYSNSTLVGEMLLLLAVS